MGCSNGVHAHGVDTVEAWDTVIGRALQEVPPGAPLLHDSLTGETSQVSQESEDSEAIIIFDWDDTLCPTTWVKSKFAHLNKLSDKFLRESSVKSMLTQQENLELSRLSDQVVRLLAKAQAIGKVMIVTNGNLDWLTVSAATLMPNVMELLERNDIRVICAMEYLKDSELAMLSKRARATESKIRAFRTLVSRMKLHAEQQRPSVVSIGDSAYEREALWQVVRDDARRHFNAKSVKLLEGPTVADLAYQLSVVSKRLTEIVSVGADLDIDLAAAQPRHS